MPIDEKSINRFGARPALIVFLVCLAVGWTAVGWHASRRAKEARRVAQIQAQARLAALELQLNRATSIRWPDVIKAAHLRDLAAEPYDYVLFLAGSAQQKPIKIDGLGAPALSDSVILPLRVGNLDMRLALQRQGGWVSKTKVALEALGVLVFAGLLCLLVNLLENREALEETLNDMNRRLTREATERQQAQEVCQNTRDEAASIQTELKDIQAARQEADSKVAEFETKLRNATEAKEAALAKLKQAEVTLTELQGRLDAAERKGEETALARKAEREEARAAIEQAQKTMSEMQARLESGVSAEKKAATAAQSQLGKAQATIVDLESRLDAATRSAKEAAEGSAAKLKKAEKTIEDLKDRLHAAEETEARVAELTELLEKTQAELVAQQNAPVISETEITPVPEELGDIEITEPAGIEEPPVETQKEEVKEVSIPPADVAAEAMPTKAPKRKKARRDDQMDFFSQPQLTQGNSTPATPPVKDLITEPVPSTLEPEAEPQTPMRHEPESAQIIAEDAKPEKHAPARKLPPPPPLDEAEFRRAVNEMLPLLTDRDPGAKDCLKANRNAYRSGFSAEAYEEFEHAVKGSDYIAALELLKKAGRRHGVSV